MNTTDLGILVLLLIGAISIATEADPVDMQMTDTARTRVVEPGHVIPAQLAGTAYQSLGAEQALSAAIP